MEVHYIYVQSIFFFLDLRVVQSFQGGPGDLKMFLEFFF